MVGSPKRPKGHTSRKDHSSLQHRRVATIDQRARRHVFGRAAPHAEAHDQAYDAIHANYAVRQHVKPRLTGWAQINGSRGEIRETSEMAARLDNDLWYIRNWNVALDLWILLRTPWSAVAFQTRLLTAVKASTCRNI